MAEDVVNFLVDKLGNVMRKEARLLYDVKDQVEIVKRELRRIQCFLKDADSKSKRNDSRAKNWVKEVREMSYRIEDVIDTFLAEIWRIDQSDGGFINDLGRLINQPAKLYSWHNLGTQLNKIQARISEIAASTDTYKIENLGENSQEPANLLIRQLVLPNTEPEIVRSDSEKKNIVKLLLENTSRRRVVSIVGQGGLGKTTLAQSIYNSTEVKESGFEYRIWSTISKKFQQIEFLKDALRQLRDIKNDEMNRNKEYFAGEIRELLSTKKFIVVLDDVWEENAWSSTFERTFPDVNNGSRVLITTRSLEVARLADLTGLYELQFLNENDSLELLLKKAIPKEDDTKDYPLDLVNLATQFVKTCGRLPLALVVVGGRLSTKPPNYSVWDTVLKTMNWSVDGKYCMEIIGASYEDLPFPHKPCFLYLALFPQNYEIEAELLTRMWVVEGLIPNEPGITMEDTAKKYLEQLEQRCMILVSRRSFIDGSIESFRVHDLLRELAISEAKEKDFLNVISKPDDLQSTDVTRRATFQLHNSSWSDTSFEEKKLIEYVRPNVRILIFFKNVVPFDSQLKLLTVLVVEDYDNQRNIPTWCIHLKKLCHLRCLAFIKCTFCYGFILPVDHWHNLQTLNLHDTYDIKVPKCLWSIKTLRHVIGNNLHLEPTNLPNLQTLDHVKVGRTSKGLFEMPDLRKLNLSAEREDSVSETNVVLPLEIISFLPNYQHLQTLILSGQWPNSVAIKDHIFPPHLIKLVLGKSHIHQDFILVLEKLQSLKTLHIRDQAYMEDELTCSKGGFRMLQELNLSYLHNIKKWKIEEGALPALKKLEISCCKRLPGLPELQHVTTLQVLTLKSMRDEFRMRVQNEEQHKINHIPSIIHEGYFPHHEFIDDWKY